VCLAAVLFLASLFTVPSNDKLNSTIKANEGEEPTKKKKKKKTDPERKYYHYNEY